MLRKILPSKSHCWLDICQFVVLSTTEAEYIAACGATK